MDNTWIKLYRKSLDSQVFENEGLWKLWSYCMLKASYEERWVTVKIGKGETQVKLLPGQFIFGRLSAAKKLRQKPSTVRNRMQKLQKMGNLDIQEDTHYSIVTLCNWEEHQKRQEEEGQPEGPPEDSHRTAIGPPEDTNKKVEKVKKEKNDKNTHSPAPSGTASPTPQEIVEAWNLICAAEGLPEVTKLSPNRRDKIMKRLRAYPEEQFWEDVMNKIRFSDFLSGREQGSSWNATFDWLFSNDQNPLKVFEDNYKNKQD